MPTDVQSRLLQAKSVVLTTHVSPDGDALGSVLALGRYLEGRGARVDYILSDEPAPNLDWLPGIDDLQFFDGSLRQREAIAAADLIVIADTNAAHRLGSVGDAIRNASAEKILIDHHPAPEGWFDRSFVRETASSTGELIYDLIEPDTDRIDAAIATLLYTAIMTDTGSFRYSHVTPRVHRIIADLIERGGLNPDDIHAALYDTRSINSLRLLGRALERITLLHGGVLGYMALPKSIMQDVGAQKGDTEGLVNQILSIDGVQVAVFFHEIDKGTKVSFRSRGDYSVTRWAQAFGGGGHRNASGAFITEPLEQVVPRVIAAAPNYLDLPPDNEAELSDEDQAYLSEMLKLKSQTT